MLTQRHNTKSSNIRTRNASIYYVDLLRRYLAKQQWEATVPPLRSRSNRHPCRYPRDPSSGFGAAAGVRYQGSTRCARPADHTRSACTENGPRNDAERNEARQNGPRNGSEGNGTRGWQNGVRKERIGSVERFNGNHRSQPVDELEHGATHHRLQVNEIPADANRCWRGHQQLNGQPDVAVGHSGGRRRAAGCPQA